MISAHLRKRWMLVGAIMALHGDLLTGALQQALAEEDSQRSESTHTTPIAQHPVPNMIDEDQHVMIWEDPHRPITTDDARTSEGGHQANKAYMSACLHQEQPPHQEHLTPCILSTDPSWWRPWKQNTPPPSTHHTRTHPSSAPSQPALLSYASAHALPLALSSTPLSNPTFP